MRSASATHNTIVMVTHDMGVHANFSDRVAVLYAGQLIEEADTPHHLQAPEPPLHAAPDPLAAQAG